MKLTRYAVLATVMGTLAFADRTAFAQTAAAMTPPVVAANTGKTRAEVRAELVQAELVQAEQQGLLPVSKNNYPPTQQAIARNRTEYLARYQDDRSRLASN
ncbi:DUF4148 domain-containing protein [Paraburkholderia sp. BCC1885]|uniref:DUF4148 domain-containing protein n=1 Tax=Paraburkholderia sp. BCC1885 TaxID=2562669 RepID=UPI0011828C15|nr:DUF4148 domain-containing protein [Paraburkholderia sp. BCC1885]